MSQEQIVVRRPSFLSAGNSQEDILRLLDSLEDLAENTQSFLGRAWGLNLEEFHMLTNKIRASLPDEVRRASRVANDSDKIVTAAKEEAAMIVEQARNEADRVVEEARQMAAKLIDTSEIGKMAKSQAQEMMANAESAAREIRRGADEYAREVLASIENHLAKVMGTLQKGREKLEVRIVAQEAGEPLIPTGRGIRR
jgi:cell division septum initiation protein DivIVA